MLKAKETKLAFLLEHVSIVRTGVSFLRVTDVTVVRAGVSSSPVTIVEVFQAHLSQSLLFTAYKPSIINPWQLMHKHEHTF